jgi:hypothetical protein
MPLLLLVFAAAVAAALAALPHRRIIVHLERRDAALHGR